MHSMATFSAIGGSNLRTRGFFVPQYSLKEAAEQEMQKMIGIPDKEPDIQFVEFRNSALDLQLEVNVTTIEMKEKLETRLRHAIARLLHENGIQLAANPSNPPM